MSSLEAVWTWPDVGSEDRAGGPASVWRSRLRLAGRIAARANVLANAQAVRALTPALMQGVVC